jgi:hypothetical protein
MDSDSFDMLAKQTRSQLRGVLGVSLKQPFVSIEYLMASRPH